MRDEEVLTISLDNRKTDYVDTQDSIYNKGCDSPLYGEVPKYDWSTNEC